MANHLEVAEFETWQRSADAEEARAREAERDGRYLAARDAARAAARHALQGMMLGITTWVARYTHESWEPALTTALEATPRSTIEGPIVRCRGEHGAKDEQRRRPTRDDVAVALDDLAVIREFVDVTWRTFTAELDAAEARGGLTPEP